MAILDGSWMGSDGRGLYRWMLARQAERQRVDVSGRSAIVFAPHPDDETLGCGGTILLKRQAGAPVCVVFMTDGSRSHASVVEPRRMREIRRGEGTAACAALNVGADDVEFLDYEDGRLSEHVESAAGAVERVLRRRECDEVYVTHRCEPPPDHRAAREAVLAGIKRIGKPMDVWEYPIWCWARWPWIGGTSRPVDAVRRWAKGLCGTDPDVRLPRRFNRAVRIDGVLEVKKAALARHRSQTQRLVDDPRYMTLQDLAGGAFVDLFFQSFEMFYQRSQS